MSTPTTSTLAATPPMPNTPPPPVVQVPPPPPPHVLTFMVGIGFTGRDDLNVLSNTGKVVFPVLRLAVVYDHRGYSHWRLDTDHGRLVLRSEEGYGVSVPASELTPEEVAAIRFLSAVVDGGRGTEPRSNGWRAHLVEQLGSMVPLVDFDGDPVPTDRAADFYRAHVVQN